MVTKIGHNLLLGLHTVLDRGFEGFYEGSVLGASSRWVAVSALGGIRVQPLR